MAISLTNIPICCSIKLCKWLMYNVCNVRKRYIHAHIQAQHIASTLYSSESLATKRKKKKKSRCRTIQLLELHVSEVRYVCQKKKSICTPTASVISVNHFFFGGGGEGGGGPLDLKLVTTFLFKNDGQPYKRLSRGR